MTPLAAQGECHFPCLAEPRRSWFPACQFARVVKGVDLRSTAGNCARVRTPQLTCTPQMLVGTCTSIRKDVAPESASRTRVFVENKAEHIAAWW